MPDGRVLWLDVETSSIPLLDGVPVDVEAERMLMRLAGVPSWPVIVIDAVTAAMDPALPESSWAVAIEAVRDIERAADQHVEIGLATGITCSRFIARGFPSWVLWSLLQRHPNLGWA